MMYRLFRWIGARVALRRAKGATRMALRWKADSSRFRRCVDRDMRLLRSLQNQLSELRQELDGVAEAAVVREDEWRQLVREHGVVEDSLLSKVRGFEDALVPFLVSMNELQLQRIKASIATFAAKEALSAPRKEEVLE